MQARTTAEEVRALRAATEHMRMHVRWHSSMRFLEPPELRTWHPYCCVRGLTGGYVVLQLRLGALIREVRSLAFVSSSPQWALTSEHVLAC